MEDVHTDWFLWIATAEMEKCLECFCTVLLCWTVIRATHDLLADRAPMYHGCPCRDPLGCPLIPKQDSIKNKAPTLWLLLWTGAGMYWLRVRACDHHWKCCHKHTPWVECTCRGFRPFRLALCRTVHLQSELVGERMNFSPRKNWAIYLQHQLMVFVAITRVTVHLVNTIAGSTRIKLTIINDLAHFHYFHLEIRNVVAIVIGVLIDTPLVRIAIVASNDLPLGQTTVFVESPLLLNCLDCWYLALYRHWHINNSVSDDTLWRMIWSTSIIFHDF